MSIRTALLVLLLVAANSPPAASAVRTTTIQAADAYYRSTPARSAPTQDSSWRARRLFRTRLPNPRP
jgi:hypothetical protein